MSIKFSGVGRQTVIYGLGVLLNKAVSFIMLPVYTRFLTPADYGTMELIAMTLDVISIVAGARLALGVFRYYHKAETDVERQEVVSTAMLALGASYILVGMLAFAFAPQLSRLVFSGDQHATLIRLASTSLAFQSCLLVPLTYARLKDRSTLYVMANLAKLGIGLLMNLLLLVYLGLGVKAVFIADLASSIIVGLVMAVKTFREVGFAFSRAATRDLLRYGVPLMGMQVATFIATFGDRYFLQRLGNTTEVGLYSLAYQFGFLLAAVGYMPFAMVWEPTRFEVAKRPREERDAMLSRGFIYVNLVLVTLAVGIALFVEDVLRVMATAEFVRAASVVPLILVAYVVQSWASVQDLGIHMREKTEYVALANWIAAGLAVLLYWLLIPKWLGFGAALATAIAFIVRYLLTYWISQRLWRVDYQWGPVWRIVVLATSTVAVGYLLPDLPLVASIGARTLLFTLYLVGVWTTGAMPAEDRARVRALRIWQWGPGWLASRASGSP